MKGRVRIYCSPCSRCFRHCFCFPFLYIKEQTALAKDVFNILLLFPLPLCRCFCCPWGHSFLFRCENGLYFNHVLEWWEAAQADPEHILFLRYEDMLASPEEHIRKIGDFAGIPYTPESVAKVRGSIPRGRPSRAGEM